MKRSVKASCVGLSKQPIAGAFNLHKLPAKGFKAGGDNVVIQLNREGGEPLSPMTPELTDDVAKCRLINDGLLGHDGHSALTSQMSLKDPDIVFDQDGGIRDQPIGGQGMGLATPVTDDPEDPERLRAQRNLDPAYVIAMPDQISAPPAGTGKLME